MLDGRVHEHHEVLGIARRDALKTEQIGSSTRQDSPFFLQVDDGDRKAFVDADVLTDATGVYETPNGLGPGGPRAIGEKNSSWPRLTFPRQDARRLGWYTNQVHLTDSGDFSSSAQSWCRCDDFGIVIDQLLEKIFCNPIG
ncbi:MAG: hypothetical protein ABEN55_14080 [Bradymonadaceae bacterium]